MKKTCLTALLCSTLILSLTSCDPRNTTGDSTATEMTAEQEKTTATSMSEASKTISSIYPYCTGNNLYTAEGSCIIQNTLEGEELQRIEVTDSTETIIHFVSDEEILYTVFHEDEQYGQYGFYDELWSIPIHQDGQEDQLLVDQKEMIGKIADGIGFILYADQQVVSYMPTLVNQYHEYDRVGKKPVPVCNEDKDDYAYILPWGKGGSWAGRNFGTVLLARYLDAYDDLGIYVHKAGSGKIEKIATHHIDNHSSGLHVTATETGIYYTCLHKRYSSPFEDADTIRKSYSYDIWFYDTASGDNKVLITKEQLQEVCPTLSSLEMLFADGDSIYAIADCEGKDEYYDFVFRISSTGEIIPEKKLNKRLTSFAHTEIVGLAGNKFYLDMSEDDDSSLIHYVFDLSTQKMKKVKKNDPEYFLWKYGDETNWPLVLRI